MTEFMWGRGVPNIIGFVQIPRVVLHGSKWGGGVGVELDTLPSWPRPRIVVTTPVSLSAQQTNLRRQSVVHQLVRHLLVALLQSNSTQ